MRQRSNISYLLLGKVNALLAKQNDTPSKLGKLEKLGIWFTIGGTIASAVLAVVSIILTVKISKQQTDIKDLNLVIGELREQNKIGRQAMANVYTQIDTLKSVARQLRTANIQGLELNRQVVDLVEEARNQSRISLSSDEPQIGIVKPVVSYVKAMLDEDSSEYSDAATFNQTIVFKNHGKREAIPKAIYVYLFKIERSVFENNKSKHKNSSSEILTIAKASTGSIDTTINYQIIAPGDTLGYSCSTYILGYWNAEDLVNNYEVIKIIYKDPQGGDKEKKFYFQYDSNASVNFVIPKSIQNALDNITKKPPTTSKGTLDPFVGIIRPNR